VGYGDYSGKDSTLQMIYIMILEMAGLAVFSSVIGSFQNIKIAKTSIMILNEKKDEIVDFLQRLDEAIPPELPNEIYEWSLEHLENNYEFGVKHMVSDNEFFEAMKPQDRRSLIYTML
jgi:hypothetical protein